MTQTELLVGAALAAWQAVEVWRHSALMATPRARAQAYGGFLYELTGCGFCLSVWAGCAAYLGLAATATPWAPHSPWWLRLPAEGVRLSLAGFGWGLAASRLANLGNDLTHASCRTPHADEAALGETDEGQPAVVPEADGREPG